MDTVHAPSNNDPLLADLQAAFERWMALCRITAQEDGVSDVLLEQELSWLRWRLHSLCHSGRRQHIQDTIQDIADAEAWVQAGRRGRLCDGPAAAEVTA